ncbi:MAG TPA: adenylate kinase [Chloroflexota bacterium]
MRIVLLGPPGVGKGTQAKRLARINEVKHLTTGELVREEIRMGTPLGHEIQRYNDLGELVPDEVIVGMIKPYLTMTESWILDGFPRDETQARALEVMLDEAGLALDRVIALSAPDDELIDRLSGRRQSAATGKTYHLTFDPPPAGDPGPFIQRVDDSPEDIRHRLEVYHSRTEPLKRYYEERDLLSEVDAGGSMDATTEAILQVLGSVNR